VDTQGILKWRGRGGILKWFLRHELVSFSKDEQVIHEEMPDITQGMIILRRLIYPSDLPETPEYTKTQVKNWFEKIDSLINTKYAKNFGAIFKKFTH